MDRIAMRKFFDEAYTKALAEAIGHAKSANWKWFTADELVTPNPCVVSYVVLTATGNACTCTLHDGIDVNGEIIAILETTAAQTRPFAFHDEILTKKGLYVNLSGDVLGILIVWHDVPKSLGG